MAHKGKMDSTDCANKDHQSGIKQQVPATQKPFSHKGAAAVQEQKGRKARQKGG